MLQKRDKMTPYKYNEKNAVHSLQLHDKRFFLFLGFLLMAYNKYIFLKMPMHVHQLILYRLPFCRANKITENILKISYD